MISFSSPFYLLALIPLILLIVFVHFFSLKHARRKAVKFANFEAIERITGTTVISRNVIPFYIRIAMIVFLVLAISGMKFDYVGASTGETYVMAIDSSTSMMAQDILPNRLEAAKTAAIKFVDNVPGGTEIGVLSFAGTTFIEELITSDKDRLKDVINNINAKESGGTDLFGAIITSANMLQASKKNGAIVLLTDGQFNTKSLEDILIYLDNTPVYALGIGTEEGGSFVTGVVSRLEENTLRSIANESQGQYFTVNTKEEMEAAYSEIITLKREKKVIDLSTIFLAIAIVLLAVDWALLSTKYKTLP